MDFIKENWDLSRPPESDIGDRDVPILENYLEGKKLALLVTAGIAAMKAPLIARSLRRMGASVTVFIGKEALRYVGIDALAWACKGNIVTSLTANSDHLETKYPFDAYLVAPCTYNTINKLANGIADNLVTTTLASAIGMLESKKSRVFIVPTMHGSMQNSILERSIRHLQDLGVDFVPPRIENGKLNIPRTDDLTHWVCRNLASSPLKGKRIVVSAGPTPVPIDSVRRIVTLFKGKTGVAIAEELWMRGAKVELILGGGLILPSVRFLPFQIAKTFEEYSNVIKKKSADCYVLSAAVADYKCENIEKGKIRSGKTNLSINLIPTEKVVDVVRQLNPDSKVLSFKLEADINDKELLEIGKKRILEKGHDAVVLNHLSETSGRSHRFLLLKNTLDHQEFVGHSRLAKGVADLCEDLLCR